MNQRTRPPAGPGCARCDGLGLILVLERNGSREETCPDCGPRPIPPHSNDYQHWRIPPGYVAIEAATLGEFVGLVGQLIEGCVWSPEALPLARRIREYVAGFRAAGGNGG